MIKKFTIALFCLVAFSSFSQSKKIDSLKSALNNNPNDFYLHREIISYFINKSQIENAKREIEIAKLKFRNNLDYNNYFKINHIYLLLTQGDLINADKRLTYFEKTIKCNNLPITKTHIYFFRGVIIQKNGDQKSAKEYFEKCFLTIKENKLEKKYFINCFNFYANSLLRLGEYQKSLSVLFEMLGVKENKIQFPVYNSIGVCFYNLKQFNKAEHYYKLAVKNSDIKNMAQLNSNLALLLLQLKKNKEAESLINRLDFKKFTSSDSSMVFNVLGEIESRKKNYKQSIKHYKTIINIDKKLANKTDLANDYLSIGGVYKKINDLKLADLYFNESYKLLNQFEDKNAKKTLLESIIELEFIKSSNLKGKNYFNEFLRTSDSINSDIVQKNTNTLSVKYETELKESQIKTQQLQIEQEKNNKYIAFGGIGFLVLLSGGVFLWFKNKQKQNNLKTENTLLGLQQNLIEAELSNLNNQLDPHEIKNLLASISPEIQEKAPESYKKMLKLFNLTKASLNSNSITDSIENQLQQIDDFLSLEKSMTAISLEYVIENNYQNTQRQIPRLLLKNLVENAIKHGIKAQETGGNIAVKIEEKDNFVYITVDDTGKGRKHAISLDSGIGTSTYQKLFATLNPKNKENATFEIIDKERGTKVVVKIPVEYKYN